MKMINKIISIENQEKGHRYKKQTSHHKKNSLRASEQQSFETSGRVRFSGPGIQLILTPLGLRTLFLFRPDKAASPPMGVTKGKKCPKAPGGISG